MKTQRASEELIAILEAGILPAEERQQIGVELAHAGDTRPGVGLLDNGLPDIDWVQVPEGSFLLGSTLGDLTANMTEVPQESVSLTEYYISRYPVTYAQYEAFVSDKGYQQTRHWTKLGKKWRGRKSHPQVGWRNAKWHLGNHPVIGITWYEATAFCSWMSEKLNHLIRLPSESEWEKAARGTDGRRFPWGNQFNPHYANCGQTVQADPFMRQMETISIGRTTAVGIYIDGASPYGALDMCGNVWEWTMSIWRENYTLAEDNTLESVEKRVVRGGSWSERESHARTASRRSYSPNTQEANIGFRICAAGE